MRQKTAKRIGLAIVGAGKVGLMRGEIAARFPSVDWIGLAEIDATRGKLVAERINADFVTTDYRELLKRTEVNAVIISTVGHLHAHPTLVALENPNKPALLIEKPLSNDLAESEKVLTAIRQAGVDAVIGYTQRFRRRWLVAKEKIGSGALGDVSTVTSRAFLNRLVALNNYKREPDPTPNSPMVISGTHALDIVMWIMEGRTPVEIYARSTDKAFGALCRGTDATAGTMSFSDGAIYQSVVNWALPISWPGAVYGLEVGIVGTEGVMTIDDSHRDIVLAGSRPQEMGHVADSSRLVDFVGSTPAGDMALGELRGPMHAETQAWLMRLSTGAQTVHATAAEGHNRLMLAKAYDLSARIRRPVALPISPLDEKRVRD
ncbi:MAG TPA: Gfo/Idh/MocA family oxidoreductase [Burkholderiales bacterium]|nr:Gfo/Idh/MocA family oxidoreductase [Burkholderiales bacterium]